MRGNTTRRMARLAIALALGLIIATWGRSPNPDDGTDAALVRTLDTSEDLAALGYPVDGSLTKPFHDAVGSRPSGESGYGALMVGFDTRIERDNPAGSLSPQQNEVHFVIYNFGADQVTANITCVVNFDTAFPCTSSQRPQRFESRTYYRYDFDITGLEVDDRLDVFVLKEADNNTVYASSPQAAVAIGRPTTDADPRRFFQNESAIAPPVFQDFFGGCALAELVDENGGPDRTTRPIAISTDHLAVAVDICAEYEEQLAVRVLVFADAQLIPDAVAPGPFTAQEPWVLPIGERVLDQLADAEWVQAVALWESDTGYPDQWFTHRVVVNG